MKNNIFGKTPLEIVENKVFDVFGPLHCSDRYEIVNTIRKLRAEQLSLKAL